MRPAWTRHRSDDNERELVKLAESTGAVWIKGPPLDGWLFWRGRWHLCEVKQPGREGRADEFTPEQIRLIARLQERQIPWHVLRTEDDVLRLLGARRGA